MHRYMYIVTPHFLQKSANFCYIRGLHFQVKWIFYCKWIHFARKPSECCPQIMSPKMQKFSFSLFFNDDDITTNTLSRWEVYDPNFGKSLLFLFSLVWMKRLELHENIYNRFEFLINKSIVQEILKKGKISYRWNVLKCEKLEFRTRLTKVLWLIDVVLLVCSKVVLI